MLCFVVSTQDDEEAKRDNWDSDTTQGRENYFLAKRNIFFWKIILKKIKHLTEQYVNNKRSEEE